MSVTPAPTRVFDQEVEAVRDDSGESYSGWFCIATNPFPCPGEGCTFVANYMTAAHLIVVFPREDDPKLYAQAAQARDLGRNPRIVEYEQSFGPCIPIDVWNRIGRPVHGQQRPPEDWPERTRL